MKRHPQPDATDRHVAHHARHVHHARRSAGRLVLERHDAPLRPTDVGALPTSTLLPVGHEASDDRVCPSIEHQDLLTGRRVERP